MKILLCTPTYQQVTHGPAKFAQLLMQINEQYPEHEIRVLTECEAAPEHKGIYRLSLSYPRPFYALGKFIRMLAYHRKAMQLRNTYEFDVIVYNDGIQGFYSAVRKPKGIAVAGMLNDDDYLSTRLSSFRRFPKARKWVISRIHRSFEKWFVRQADLTITCSKYLRQEVINQYRVNPEKVTALYQGTDPTAWHFKPRAPFLHKHEIKVLFVKSDFMRGGLAYLIQALALINHLTFELFIVGPFDSMQPDVEQLYLPAPNIHYRFRGVQPQIEVHRLMHEADLLCIPSLQEGLGVANVEGLATGLPVVSTAVGGIPEVLGNGQYGWLAEPANVDSLKETILQCISQDDERMRRSRLGRAHIEETFGHEQMIRNFIALMNNIIPCPN